jgi:mannose/cellobiose epimerase-like protein (N-acyl-D-glucosamine 2-epimerase family)
VALPYRDTIHKWMFDTTLPWWAEHGVDRELGGYVEQITPDGHAAPIAFKRTRVTARQIYVYSHGHVLGFNPGLDVARHGVDYLINRTWLGPDKGFARRLTREGALLDATPDLYDHAFVLFALSWHHRASGDAVSRDWMHRTLDYIESHLRVKDGQGFWHELPPTGWRQQNPHMHLTEACLAAYEATGEARFADLAKEVVGVFTSHFFDTKSQTLAEYFTEDLARAPGDEGRIIEPGHQFEWSWILNSCRKQFGMKLEPQIRALAGFAEAHGVDPASKITFNTVRDDGQPIDRASRTWPNTERIKAAIALHELDGVDPSAAIATSAALLFDRYLGRTLPATWIDVVDADGKPVPGNAPASTLYHVFLAFAEVLRVGDQA